MTETHYFLGSNSPAGFCSLYNDFTDSSKDTLHIIKGFPGTGKSSFMKRIGNALSEAGADTEYIHCSGDPDSLDGVYFPQLGIAYADGTAPHVTEPRIAGAAEDYLNLGAFCNTEALSQSRKEIFELNIAYKKLYDKAYAHLAAAAAVHKAYTPDFDEEVLNTVMRRAHSALSRRVDVDRSGRGTVRRRFLSAVTCNGPVCFSDTINALADRIVVLENDFSLAPLFTSAAAGFIKKSGHDVILFPSPSAPDVIDHIVMPGLRLAFVSGLDQKLFREKSVRHIRLDCIPSKDDRKKALQKTRVGGNMSSLLIKDAETYLSRAKSLHDALESFYTPHVDFDGITALADRHIDSLLQLWTKRKNGV